MTKVRVRYAPSPTGNLHIGNARTALFNYLFAKHNGGDFVLRIEDTDFKRNKEEGERSQLKYMNWLGLDYDEGIGKEKEFGPYRQSERIDIYQKYADQLIAEDKAYKCYMTAEELVKEFDKADIYFVNIKVPRAWEKTVNTALKETQEKYSNVKLIDWYSVANSTKDLFEPDRVHLNQAGISEMVTLIEKNLKRPVEIKAN